MKRDFLICFLIAVISLPLITTLVLGLDKSITKARAEGRAERLGPPSEAILLFHRDRVGSATIVGKPEFAEVDVDGQKVSVVVARGVTGEVFVWHSKTWGVLGPNLIDIHLDSVPIAKGPQLGDCCEPKPVRKRCN
jgi:hypothetical protein